MKIQEGFQDETNHRNITSAAQIGAGILVSFALYTVSRHSFLLFHSLAEMFNAAVALGIFVVMWNSRHFLHNNYLLFIGVAYLFIGCLNVLYLLSYNGLGPLLGLENASDQLWTVVCYVEAFSFLIAPFTFGRRITAQYVFIGYVVVCGLLLTSIFYWHNFPALTTQQGAPTQFHIISTVIEFAAYMAGIVLLYLVRREFHPFVARLLLISLAITTVSNAAISLPYFQGLMHVPGLFLMIISAYLIYIAIVETGLMRPYDLLFRNLKRVQESLVQQAHDLSRTNAELEMEITERKRVQERLVAQERLATLGKVSASLAHELRNPLGVIDSSVFYLRNAGAIPDVKLKEHLDRVHAAVQRSTAIVQSLQDLTQMGEPLLTRQDVRPLLENAIKECHPSESINLVTAFPEEPVVVVIDADQFRRAFREIIRNAIQAMPGEGTLAVSVMVHERIARVSFRDTGPGISSENLPRIFEPLFSTRTVGIGLGLYIARQIVDRHGASISLQSQVGQGTTVTIAIPLASS